MGHKAGGQSLGVEMNVVKSYSTLPVTKKPTPAAYFSFIRERTCRLSTTNARPSFPGGESVSVRVALSSAALC